MIIPLVYGLLIGKSATDYNKFFQKILEVDDFTPESILSDYESGTIKSIKDLFPNAVHRGKLFFDRIRISIISNTNFRLSISFWAMYLASYTRKFFIKKISRG